MRITVAAVSGGVVVVIAAAACGVNVVGGADGTSSGGSIDGAVDEAGDGAANLADAGFGEDVEAGLAEKRTCTWPTLQPNAVWPMLGGCVTHAGRSELRGPHLQPHVLWKVDLGGGFNPVPAVDADNNPVVPADTKGVEIFSPDGGNRRDLDFGLGNVTNTPALGLNGIIYAGSSGNVVAHSPNGTNVNGVLGNEVDSSPVIDRDGNIIAGSTDGKKVASFEKGSLATRWEFILSDITNSSPAIDPVTNTIYIGANDRRLHALIGADGGEAWHFDAGGPINSSPIVGDDGVVYVGTNDGTASNVFALTRDGTLKWAWPSNAQLLLQVLPALDWNGTLHVAAGRTLTALSPADAGVISTYDAKGDIAGPSWSTSTTRSTFAERTPTSWRRSKTATSSGASISTATSTASSSARVGSSMPHLRHFSTPSASNAARCLNATTSILWAVDKIRYSPLRC